MATGQEFWDKVASGEITSLNISGMTGFHSPIDGKWVGSTKDLENHNRQHDVYQIGDEYTKDKKNEMKLKREEFLDTYSEKDIIDD